MTSTVIVAGSRTPIGRFSGALGEVPATELGGAAIRGALQRGRVDPADVDYVIMGQILTAGTGQGPARQAAHAGGIGLDVPSISVNKLCLSGLSAIAMADQMIRAGEFRTVVAGGMESMTLAPHLLPKSRAGYKYGSVTMLDHLAHDGLWDSITDQAMGALTEQFNREDDRSFSREEQDAFAVRSHEYAAKAQLNGIFDNEITPIEVPGRKGSVTVSQDEGVRPDTSLESLARLRPAFRPDGTITAGSASQISDGAAAMVVMDKELAIEKGLSWIAEIGAYGTVAGPDSTLQMQPANAIRQACRKQGIEVADLDLVEINEAFAAVGLASTRDLGISPDIVNVNGGAIALGHPVGASGARLVLHLALELGRRGGGTGVAALCGGGGQGDALILTVG
ncbi:acetyl-CoA C-acetyltransferase [Nakamurella silvestris]|nr:acetyl-CoA C-acetyltransferase [Nakamurella silvestris]